MNVQSGQSCIGTPYTPCVTKHSQGLILVILKGGSLTLFPPLNVLSPQRTPLLFALESQKYQLNC